MKGIVYFSLLLTMTFGQVLGQSYSVMTYNIRYDNPDDGPDNWEHRKMDLANFVKTNHPHLLGIQEGMDHQVTYLDKLLNDYDYIGVGRDDGKSKGEYCAIYFKRNQVEVVKTGTFWLSETPLKVSVGWDASMERICTYGLFRDRRTEQQFWVFNTHFDHRGPIAREKSASLLVRQITKLNPQQLPVVLMGDFNATPEEAPIEILSAYFLDGFKMVDKPPVLTGTNIGFNNNPEERRIDFVFSKGFKVLTYDHLDPKTSKGRNLSDHLPVVVGLKLE